jgi:hypothetical protein
MQMQKLRLQEQSNWLRMYETLYLCESSTASQEERQFAESKMRSMFFASLNDARNTSIDAGAPKVPPPYIPLHTSAESSPPVDFADAPMEHGCTMFNYELAEKTTPHCAVGDCVDVPYVHRCTEPTQLSKSLDDDCGDDEN